MTTGVWIKTICAVALLAAVLTGCGRRGDLERPGVTPAPHTDCTCPAASDADEADAPQPRSRTTAASRRTESEDVLKL